MEDADGGCHALGIMATIGVEIEAILLRWL